MSNSKRTLQTVFCLTLLCVTVAALAAGRATATDPAPPRAAQGADDAKQPFQRMLVATLDPGEFSEAVVFAVPTGKRLVVETVSANLAMPAGQKATVNFATTGGGGNGRAWLTLAAQGSISGTDRYTVTQPLRMYADSGTNVQFQAVRDAGASTAGLNFAVAGYLVDAP